MLNDFLLCDDGREISWWAEFFLWIVLYHKWTLVNPFDKNVDYVQSDHRVDEKDYSIVFVRVCIVINFFQDLKNILRAYVHVYAGCEIWYPLARTLLLWWSSFNSDCFAQESFKYFFGPFEIGLFQTDKNQIVEELEDLFMSDMVHNKRQEVIWEEGQYRNLFFKIGLLFLTR